MVEKSRSGEIEFDPENRGCSPLAREICENIMMTTSTGGKGRHGMRCFKRGSVD
jgi:hypothetical protein